MTTVDGDESSIQCPCGSEHRFDDGPPEEDNEVECECGRVLKMVSVSWSAHVMAEVKDPPPSRDEVAQ